MLCFATLIFGFQSLQAQNFVQQSTSIPGMTNGCVDFGDYDNDGDMDFVVCSSTESSNEFLQVFRNDGGSFFMTNIVPPGEALQPNGAYDNVAWGDYNNDNLLDFAVAGFDSNFTGSVRIYRNNGDGTFFRSFDLLPGDFSSLDWGDVDLDGDQDLIVGGIRGGFGTGGLSTLYLNNHNAGQNSFTLSTDTIAGLLGGSADFGDYDADGDIDLLISGYSSADSTTRLYDNDGTGHFTENSSFPLLRFGNYKWGDSDNDGDLDALFTASFDQNTFNFFCGLLVNNSGSFSIDNAAIPPFVNGDISWGDYDNDGDLDILAPDDSSMVYRNDGGNTFSNANLGLAKANFGPARWVDMNGDNKLDIIYAGQNSSPSLQTFVYFQDGPGSANTAPTAPTGLSATVVNGTDIQLSWNPSTDVETPSNVLSYHVSLGETDSTYEYASPFANLSSSGKRTWSSFAQIEDTFHTFKGLIAGQTYCAAVTAVDGSFEGSAYSTAACLMTVGIEESLPAMVLTAFPNPASNQIQLAWDGGEQASVELMDLQGNVLQQHEVLGQSGKRLDVSNLAQGVYLLRVVQQKSGQHAVLKFVKQ